MSLIEINWNPPPKQLRAFAVAQFVFFYPDCGTHVCSHESQPVAAGTDHWIGDRRCSGIRVPATDSHGLRCLDGSSLSHWLGGVAHADGEFVLFCDDADRLVDETMRV
jgi:hypothetical protein